MQVQYQYASPSRFVRQDERITLAMSPDLSREEQVSFRGKLKNPLVFRDAMLMLREIIVSNAQQKKKERVAFFQWLQGEIARRMQEHEKFLPGLRAELQNEIDQLLRESAGKDAAIAELMQSRKALQAEIDQYDAWHDYNQLERKFWQFIRERDQNLWFVLDPVITVHPDQVSFEAFSIDESIYGCLAIALDEFEMSQEPLLGTTNIDFS
ncbi:MAG: hypothetical protein FWC60_10850, partial [Firmicutes bacterium]|nr:hypothetical protein [Bacillota bacterium]